MALTVLLAAAALMACGDSSGGSAKDEQAAEAVILKLSDLPQGSALAKKAVVSERCSPVTYFRSYATAVNAPPGFVLPEVELLQTVGVFEDEEQARKAFDEITSEAARDCVGAEMQKTARRMAGTSGELGTKFVHRSLPDETTRAMRLVLSTGFGGVEVERTAMLHGRMLTTLTFISQNQPIKQGLWESVSHNTANRIDKAASSIES